MKRGNLCSLQTDFTLHLSIIINWYIYLLIIISYQLIAINFTMMTYTWTPLLKNRTSFNKKQNEFLKNHFFSCSIIDNIQKIMLYYVAINKSEGLDCSEGQDCARNTALKSRQCTSCQFYFYIRNNYRYKKKSVMDVIKA